MKRNNRPAQKYFSSVKKGMTLMEILIVVSLISIISVAIYNALSNGIRVWERNHRLVIEEDIIIFFDKITQDLRNSFNYSQLSFEGQSTACAFPTFIHTLADPKSNFLEGDYVDQLGKVQYYFDPTQRAIYKKEANYGQALKNVFSEPRLMVSSVEDFKLRYVYLTENGESISEEVLEVPPSSIEIEIEFKDDFGQRILKKFIDIPIGS